MKISELLQNTSWVAVPKARNLARVSWWAGYMLVQFRSSADLWVYGPDIPEVEKDKLLRVPYPDKIFSSNIKSKFKCHKVF